MELRHLRYFVAVAEELHFGRAAQRLHISQPPLSQQIRALERELGVELFTRGKRRVELTHAGKVFLQQANLVLAAAGEAAEAARRAERGETGRLAIGFIHAASFNLLPEILRRFRQRMPAVELSLQELSGTAQQPALTEGSIDVGLLRPPLVNALLDVDVLVRERLIVGLPHGHRLARREEISLRELAAEPFVLYTPGRSPLYGQVLSACQKAGFVPKVVQHSMHIMTLIGLVRGGMGVVVLPAAASAVRMDGIRYRPLRYSGPKAETAVVWRRSDASTITRGFLQICREVAAEGSARQTSLPTS